MGEVRETHDRLSGNQPGESIPEPGIHPADRSFPCAHYHDVGKFMNDKRIPESKNLPGQVGGQLVERLVDRVEQSGRVLLLTLFMLHLPSIWSDE